MKTVHIVVILMVLRNESNIFSVGPGINQKRTENCINARSVLLQTFSVLFQLIPRSTEKI